MLKKSFITESGLKVPAVTAEQMREIDRIATEETGPNLYQMMENAGRNLAELSLHALGSHWKSAKVLVLAGGGGNGGGGLCAARHLANRDMRVEYCLASGGAHGEVSEFQRKVLQSTHAAEVILKPHTGVTYDLIIDALIGYGLRSAPVDDVAEAIEWVNDSRAPVLSLDIASGVDATTGHKPGIFIKPQWTMTLALPKTGLDRVNAGELFLADIGIPAEVFRRLGIEYVPPFENRYWIRLEIN